MITPWHLKVKSGVDKIIVKKQPYQLLNTSRQFFPSFHALNFHKLTIYLRKLISFSFYHFNYLPKVIHSVCM